jgi:Signal transduction histidine kinase
MKIRTQFQLLIGGIIIVPVIVMGALLLIEYYRAPERTLIPGYREVSRIAGTDISQKDWEQLSAFISRKPQNIDFIILDTNSTVLHSTVAEFPAASRLSDPELIRLIRGSNNKYLYQMDSPTRTGESKFLVVTRILRHAHRPPDPIAGIIRSIMAVFLIVLAFSCSMSFLIARSITRSVTILEENTRRIAAGELDLSIDARGSNEITSLTLSLNRMRLALKEEQTRRFRFIMGVSHDLKTPLALIKGYTEAISDGLADDPEMMRKSLGIVGSKVNQLEEMIDDLIGFVKMDTGEWRQHLRNHAISPILQTFARRIASDGNLLKRTVEYDIAIPDTVIVPLDERLFLRALENITTNSIRYTAEGGLVRIEAGMESDGLIISVSDNGSGIAREDIPHIFDLFYRGSNSRREEGMGLGLTVVRNVADSHGWSVSVTSDPGKLTKFAIRIPISQILPVQETLPPA